MGIKKQYILKPGKHRFIPGSPAIHHNGNLTDQEAEWYLQRFPHIKTCLRSFRPERKPPFDLMPQYAAMLHTVALFNINQL